MRILFINHTAECGGAEAAMLRLLVTLGAKHDVVVACPVPGPLPDRLRRLGIECLPIHVIHASFRFHPVGTARGVMDIARTASTVHRVIGRVRPDVIHANTLRAGLIAVPGARVRARPLLVQVHDVLPDGSLAPIVRATLAAGADAVSAVSDKSAASFNAGLRRPKASRNHISIDHARFDPRTVTESSLRAELGIGDAPLLAEVAQITPWKGQHVAIEVLYHLRKLEPSAHLALIGRVTFASARYDNLGYERELHALVDRLGLQQAVHFVGARDDVPEVMMTSDLTLLPSTDEPFGTVALESMAMGTPALVSGDGGMREFVEDGVSGRVLPVQEPGLWAEAAKQLLDDRRALSRMGTHAIRSAARFTDDRYAGEMEARYREMLADRRQSAKRRP